MYLEERRNGESNREYALRILKANIIQMILEPGCPIGEQKIAKELGMSRTPVREALVELMKTRIVEILPQKGTYVSYLDYDLVEEARFMRMTLELALLDELAEKMTDKDFDRMEANVTMQRFYLERENQLYLMQLDDDFHRMFLKSVTKCNAIVCQRNLAFILTVLDSQVWKICVIIKRFRITKI